MPNFSKARLSPKIRATQKNTESLPNQSGTYILHRGSGSKYVGSAGAGRLRQRIVEQLSTKRGVTSFQARLASSPQAARKQERIYRDKFNPTQKRI